MRFLKPITVFVAIVSMIACTALKKQSSGDWRSLHKDTIPDLSQIMEYIRDGYPKTDWAQVYYIEGIKQFEVYGQSGIALRFCDEAIKIDSLYAPAYYQAARIIVASDPAKALLYTEKANRADSTQMWYKHQLGMLLVMNKKYDEAEKIYEELIKISPHSPENYSMLAALYEHNNQPFSAIAILNKGEAVIGKVEQLTAYKRELLVKVGLFDQAIEEAREIVNVNPYDYQNYLSLAQLYAETKKDSLALKSYKEALVLNPNGIDIIVSMNEYYKQINDNANYLETAKQIFQSDEVRVELKINFFKELSASRNFYLDNSFRIRELSTILYSKYPENWDVIEIYIDNLLKFGEIEEAIKIYKHYVGTGIGGIDLYYQILDIEGYMQRMDSVNKYLAIALRTYPDNSKLYIRQAGALIYMKNNKGALKSYDKALKYASSDSLRSVVLGAIGDLYYQQEKEKQSYGHYERALKAWPDNVMVLNNYAYFLSEKGIKLERALEMSKKVVDILEPGNATYIDTYGWILYKMGRYEEAKKVMQQAVALDSRKNKELLIHYGDVLYALGEYYMASVYWNRALEAGYDKEEIEQRLDSIKGK